MFAQPRRVITVFVLLFCVGCLFVGAKSLAAQDIDTLRPADTTSPRATLMSLVEACNEIHGIAQREKYFQYDRPEHRALARRALDCVDDSELPEFTRREAAAEAAICIKEILDRVTLPTEQQIPNREMMDASDDPDRWQIPGTRLTIARVTEGARKHEFLFSTGTVDRSLEYYEDLRALPYRQTGFGTSPGLYQWYIDAPRHSVVGAIVDRLPDVMRKKLWGLTYWKWIGLILSVVCALILLIIIYHLARSSAQRLADRHPVWYALTVVLPVIAVTLPLLLEHALTQYVALRGTWLYVVDFITSIVFLITAVVLIFAIVNRITAVFLSSPKINPQGLDAQFIRILSKIAALAISVLVCLEGGQYLGIPITTLLASAGVGGLAVALAAQDTLRNLFGTIMLMADKPFRVGDRIVVTGYDGNVEDIGLRSTRIRLLNGHQVTIPNDQLASNDVENISRRPFIRRVASIHLPLDTPRTKVEQAAQSIRAAIETHEGMAEDRPPRVFFNEFNDDSFNIKIYYWYHPADFWKSQTFAEKLNLEIMRRLEDQDIRFLMPLRVSHADFESQQAPLEIRSVAP